MRTIRSDVFPKRVLYFATLPTQNVQACTQPRRFQSPEHSMVDVNAHEQSNVSNDTQASVGNQSTDATSWKLGANQNSAGVTIAFSAGSVEKTKRISLNPPTLSAVST